MSLPAAREAAQGLGISNTAMLDESARVFPSHTTYDTTAIYNHFYDADTMAPNPKRARPNDDAPALPQRSALRASRLLDNLGLKLGGSLETVEPGQATPLDMYLSSEEDASSNADDFSDYDYDSSDEDPTSPTRRSSHEDTARVVSVIYSGKPSIIDLSLLRRRSMSPNSIETRTRSSTASSRSQMERPLTPASSVSSPVQAARKGSLLSDLVIKKRPPFLNIDPYANGSTYSLDLPRADKPQQDDSLAKPPRTPTQLFKGVTRTFSLVRKRSRPALNTTSSLQPQTRTAAPQRRSFTMGGPAPVAPAQLAVAETEVEAKVAVVEPPRTPSTPVTYGDIIKAAKKNAMVVPPSPIASTTPASPAPSQAQALGTKRGILSGLAARRRSVKLTGKSMS